VPGVRTGTGAHAARIAIADAAVAVNRNHRFTD